MAGTMGQRAAARTQFRISAIPRGSRKLAAALGKWRERAHRAFVYAAARLARWQFATAGRRKVFRGSPFPGAAWPAVLFATQFAACRSDRVFRPSAVDSGASAESSPADAAAQ